MCRKLTRYLVVALLAGCTIPSVSSAAGPARSDQEDPAEGALLLTPEGHGGGIFSVAFSPDGRRIASASRDNTVKLWDAVTGKELRTLKGHTNQVLRVT